MWLSNKQKILQTIESTVNNIYLHQRYVLPARFIFRKAWWLRLRETTTIKNNMSSNKWSASRGSSQGKSTPSFQPLSTPTSSGWGKQAAKRFDTSELFNKDPLLKSLQEKISVGFGDYKPWQRTSLPRNAAPTKPTTPKSVGRPSNRPISSRQTRSSYSAGGTSKGGNDIDRPTSGITLRSQCSSVCFHPWMKKTVITPVYTLDKRKLKFLSVLRVCLFVFYLHFVFAFFWFEIE